MDYYRVALGAHDLCLYNSAEDRDRILFSNLASGLDSGCSLLYIASCEEDMERIKYSAQNFNSKLNQSRLRVVSSRDLFIPEGVFQARDVVRRFRGLIDESLNSGSRGLFVSADFSHLFSYLQSDLELLLKYECSVGRTFSLPIETVCAYPVDQALSSTDVFYRLVQAHKDTVTQKGVVNNRKACFEVLTEALGNLFGEHATEVIFYHAEKELGTPRSELPDALESFQKYLERIYGKKIADMTMEYVARELTLKLLYIEIN